MPLDSQTHAQVKRQVKDTRNQAARGRRASGPAKAASVTLLPSTWPDGTEVLVAVQAALSMRASVLRKDETDVWRCACMAARISPLRTCTHAQATTPSGARGKE
ncbi:MAG TPA: hypothetical protein VGW38_12505 [Chloroflexota bacterium]|nr:hypothetical protein [Chloroflexota bacterium]